MLIQELVQQLITRAQTLNLTDRSTGFVDHGEIESYVQQSLRYLANRYQLQMFLEMNRELFHTTANIEQYTIPANYGFWSPEESYRSGLAISTATGTEVYNLTYYDPARFNLIFSVSNTGKPVAFTIVNNLLYFFPVPDAEYVIQALQRESQEGATEVPDVYVEAVKIETLYRMAADRGNLAPPLVEERAELLRTLVNGESRTRQRFYTSRERIGMGRYRRYPR